VNSANFPMLVRVSLLLLCGALSSAVGAAEMVLPATEDSGGDVEIVIGEDRTVYEYRSNGMLTMIKVVPKSGRPYYMVPADGSPHFTDLDHSKNLYPQWVLFEW
jgi:hypothetical protein